jgi:seryl-tRNA synthetase
MKKSSNSSNITALKKNVDLLYKTVYQGNGKPSVMTQLANLETQVKTVQEGIESLDEEIRLRIVDVSNHMNDKVRSLDTEITLKFKNVTDVVTEKFNNLSDQIKSEFNKEQVAASKKWDFRTALAAGTLASFTSICVVIVSEILKRMH